MKKNWLLSICDKQKVVRKRIVFNDSTEAEAKVEAKAEFANWNENWSYVLTPFKIINLTFYGVEWYVRITPTTFELLDSNDEKSAETGDLYFACDVGEHNLGDPTEMDDSTIFQSKEWAEWYNWEAAPAMEDYARDTKF